jgi:hypothetical protein
MDASAIRAPTVGNGIINNATPRLHGQISLSPAPPTPSSTKSSLSLSSRDRPRSTSSNMNNNNKSNDGVTPSHAHAHAQQRSHSRQSSSSSSAIASRNMFGMERTVSMPIGQIRAKTAPSVSGTTTTGSGSAGVHERRQSSVLSDAQVDDLFVGPPDATGSLEDDIK